MGQFKPMVKMETTEPSVMLKLKNGGHVNMKKGGHAKSDHKPMSKMADGGVMGALASTPALVGRPAVNAPVRVPGKPSMSARRRAMNATRMAAPVMKKGGEAESAEEHKSEMKALKGLKTELKSHEDKPASKGHKGLKSGGSTGEVKKGNAGGYKAGGSTGGVKKGQGGYADGGNVSRYVTNNVVSTPPGVTNMTTGGVRESNAGGYKKGGASKKAYATGGLVDTGRPVAMPRKPASKPVSNDRQSGTFKKGGYADGGSSADDELESYRKEPRYHGYEDYTPSGRVALRTYNAESVGKDDIVRKRGHMPYSPSAAKKAQEAQREYNSELRRETRGTVPATRLANGGLSSVTKTRESVTVTPAKKRGGAMC